LKKLY